MQLISSFVSSYTKNFLVPITKLRGTHCELYYVTEHNLSVKMAYCEYL